MSQLLKILKQKYDNKVDNSDNNAKVTCLMNKFLYKNIKVYTYFNAYDKFNPSLDLILLYKDITNKTCYTYFQPLRIVDNNRPQILSLPDVFKSKIDNINNFSTKLSNNLKNDVGYTEHKYDSLYYESKNNSKYKSYFIKAVIHKSHSKMSTSTYKRCLLHTNISKLDLDYLRKNHYILIHTNDPKKRHKIFTNKMIQLVMGKNVFYSCGCHYYKGRIKLESQGVGDFSLKNYSNIKNDVDYSNKSKRITTNDVKNTYDKEISHMFNKFINRNYDNIVVLAGAGSSISNKLIKYKNKHKRGKYSKKKNGLSMYNLANKVNLELPDRDYNLVQMAVITRFNNILNVHEKEFNYKREHELVCNNFEALLSNINSFANFVDSFNGVRINNNIYKNKVLDANVYKQTIKDIHYLIRKYCHLIFNSKFFSHSDFIQELQSLNSLSKRLKIYSTNYDTLFEQAANDDNNNFVIDGFNYESPRKFNKQMLNTDFVYRKTDDIHVNPNNISFYPNVVKIFQLHGALNWYRNINSNKVYKTNYKDVNSKVGFNRKGPKLSKDYHPCMIFPSNNKYKQSYENPYFDLFVNFQHDLRKKNTLLIVVGFSFGDMHIREMVYNAMQSNKYLHMVFVSYGGVKFQNHKSSLKSFVSNKFINRELFFKGDLSQFTEELDIDEIYDK